MSSILLKVLIYTDLNNVWDCVNITDTLMVPPHLLSFLISEENYLYQEAQSSQTAVTGRIHVLPQFFWYSISGSQEAKVMRTSFFFFKSVFRINLENTEHLALIIKLMGSPAFSAADTIKAGRVRSLSVKSIWVSFSFTSQHKWLSFSS